ncbi:DNA/RNA non-specific endonuclease [Sphingosinicella sp. BN140058]|uniref:DNA/RNA non-specific endonuclease n=1 Tax=Sphingosinicella sp. BN140058 TaxID=1892855 RepID=UPI0010101976|nr:DNA/RNA non-specific endonuclease [Sphingosinicella sp. BN140058]QAY80465.1 DNA/RNA non-specific endonuclease [Sphingosinicella sp. BN140058]
MLSARKVPAASTDGQGTGSICSPDEIMRLPRTFIPALIGLAIAACSPPVATVREPATATQERSAAECRGLYLGGSEPSLPPSQAADADRLCFETFAVLHSPRTRTALWSAEFLSEGIVRQARRLERTSDFYSEPGLAAPARANLEDYRRSGFDRGHLAPSGDMPTVSAQQESFSLANIVPQNGTLNRGDWADLESDVRDTAQRYGVAYVVTGPMFIGDEIDTLRGRVAVPTVLWKAVHVPGHGAVVTVATNEPQSRFEVMTVGAFTARYGIDPFPALAAADRGILLKLL